MASLAAVSLQEPIIPLVTTIDPDELSTVKIEHRWVDNGNNREAKMYLPTCPDGQNKELLLYVIDQFIDACDASRLNITTGPDLYSKFRGVLNGDLRLMWQMLSDSRNADPNANPVVPDTHTADNFAFDVGQLIGQYFTPTSFEDQKEYLRGVRKPFDMTCEQLSARIRVVSALGRFLPGSSGKHLFPDEDAIKRAYFSLMLPEWKIKFAESGHVLNGNYPMVNLTRFMAVQEAISKARRGHKRKDAPWHANSHERRQRRYVDNGRYGRGNGRGDGNHRGGRGGGGGGWSPGGNGGGGRGYSPRRGTPYRSGNRFAGGRGGGYYSGGGHYRGAGNGGGGGRGNGGNFSSPHRHGGYGPRSPPGVPRSSPGSAARGAFGQDGNVMDNAPRDRRNTSQDHYYHEGPHDEAYPQEPPPEDQFYGDDGYPQDYDGNYGGDPPSCGRAESDGHWMDDFGF